MTSALETINTDRVHANFFSLECVTHRCAFVNYFDTTGFERRHIRFRAASRCLYHLDARRHNSICVFIVRHRIDRRQNSQINAEGLVCHAPGAFHLLDQFLRAGLS